MGFELRLSTVLLSLILAAALPGCGGSAQSNTTPNAEIVQFTGVISAGAFDPPAHQGANGSYFLNTLTGRLFGPKANGVWPGVGISLIGTAGPPGLAGQAGPVGPAGGTAPGLYSGTTTPSNTLGTDGDFYLNTTDRSITGPKVNGTWPATGIFLVGAIGPAGAQGATGATGTAGPSGPVGPTGAAGAVGAAGAAGAAGPAGATGAVGPAGATGPAGSAGSNGSAGTNGTNGTNGTSLLGGSGSVLGTLVGALIMSVLRNGLNLLGVSSYVQQVTIGVVIVVAVLVDMALHRRTERTFR